MGRLLRGYSRLRCLQTSLSPLQVHLCDGQLTGSLSYSATWYYNVSLPVTALSNTAAFHLSVLFTRQAKCQSFFVVIAYFSAWGFNFCHVFFLAKELIKSESFYPFWILRLIHFLSFSIFQLICSTFSTKFRSGMQQRLYFFKSLRPKDQSRNKFCSHVRWICFPSITQ